MLLLLLLLQSAPSAAPLIAATYVPERVYESDRKRFGDFETMLAALARADIVFVGEQHEDPATHRLELALLEGLARRGRQPAVALEMFERDVRPLLSAYAAGEISEEEMLKGSRPWPRYATDYRPLVELAVAARWPIVASNVPRRLAALVAKDGLEALASVPESDRPFVAADRRCLPEGDEFERFAREMQRHPAGSARERRMVVERYYASQCLKDETMAESVARAHGEGARPVVHVNGAFHSDYRQGVVERTRRRLPDARIEVVTIVPLESLDGIEPSRDDRRRADYLVFTLKQE